VVRGSGPALASSPHPGLDSANSSFWIAEQLVTFSIQALALRRNSSHNTLLVDSLRGSCSPWHTVKKALEVTAYCPSPHHLVHTDATKPLGKSLSPENPLNPTYKLDVAYSPYRFCCVTFLSFLLFFILILMIRNLSPKY